MSESPGSSSSKSRAGGERRRASGAARKSGGRSPQKKRLSSKQTPLIRVIEDDSDQDVTLVDQLKKEAKTGLPSVAVSSVLHAVILLVMALIVVRLDVDTEGPLNFGWMVDAPDRKPLEKVVRAPVKLQSFKLTPTETVEPKEEPKPDAEEAPKIVRPVKPVDVAKSLENRLTRNKAGKVDGTGTKNSVEQAINLGLDWLKRQQKSGGNWQLHTGYPDAGERVLRTDTGATALALLAFLGEGHTQFEGDYRDTVAGGLRWLRGIQKADGDYHDHSELGRQTAFYAHSQATIAICEAYAMTGDRELASSAERAIEFLLQTQHPSEGGWRYQPQDVDSMGDLSVTGWALMALHTARMAGINVPDEALGRASNFLDQVSVRDGALYKYLPSDPDGKTTPAMTACGLLGRQWLGWSKTDPAMIEGVAWLQRPEFRPEWSGGKRNVYEWYYVAQALHNMGGDPWKRWFEPVQDLIVEGQKRRGSRKAPTDVQGSWDPTAPYGSNEEYSNKAGRLYLTVMCLLVLETPTRHVPIYGESAEGEAPEL